MLKQGTASVDLGCFLRLHSTKNRQFDEQALVKPEIKAEVHAEAAASEVKCVSVVSSDEEPGGLHGHSAAITLPGLHLKQRDEASECVADVAIKAECTSAPAMAVSSGDEDIVPSPSLNAKKQEAQHSLPQASQHRAEVAASSGQLPAKRAHERTMPGGQQLPPRVHMPQKCGPDRLHADAAELLATYTAYAAQGVPEAQQAVAKFLSTLPPW